MTAWPGSANQLGGIVNSSEYAHLIHEPGLDGTRVLRRTVFLRSTAESTIDLEDTRAQSQRIAVTGRWASMIGGATTTTL